MIEGPVVSIKDLIGGGYNRFWHDKSFYRVVKGSRGSKKSKTAAINFVERIMKHPWANLLVVRRFSNTLKQSTYTDLKRAIARLGVKHLWKTNESVPELTYKPTGQKILFRGLDDPLKITSITVEHGMLCWAWFEEAFEIETEHKFSTVVESIRGSHESDDFFKQVTITFNPWSERHWLKKVFFDEATRRSNTFSTTTTFRVNEWLDEVDRARYENSYHTNPRREKIVCDGEWGIADGLVFERFRVEEFTRLDDLPNYAGLDFGFATDPTAFIDIQVDEENKKLYVCDEDYQTGMLKYKQVHKRHIVADSAEPKTIEELRRSGITHLQEYEIIIHPRCTNFIIEINNYVWDKDRLSGESINKPIDDYNHLMDALRYAVEYLHVKPKKRREGRKLSF